MMIPHWSRNVSVITVDMTQHRSPARGHHQPGPVRGVRGKYRMSECLNAKWRYYCWAVWSKVVLVRSQPVMRGSWSPKTPAQHHTAACLNY